MTVDATSAAKELELSDPGPHKLISLLMAGAIERVVQTRECIKRNNHQDKTVLVNKTIAIVNGLRESLDFDKGGDIAVTLDSLYEYILTRLSTLETDDKPNTSLIEIERLLTEVKSGWDQIEDELVA
jgi:flagellar protein FliS